MLKHARSEVELAKKLEMEGRDTDGDLFDYGGACYDSALRAFESLTLDGHSGFSVQITKQILNRLIDGKPLTPIVERDDIWNKVSYDEHDNYTTYQCKRMSSLFKEVYTNGEIRYKDISSFHCVDINTNDTYHSSLAQEVINEMFPIVMPYMPLDSPIEVYCEDFLANPKNGDFDTVGLLYLVTPNGERIIIDKYFKEGETGWVEIDPVEYVERSHLANSTEIQKED